MAVIPTHKDFLDIFNRISPNKHRYTVFTDFVTMFAISLHNAIVKNEKLEEEYLRCIKGYAREDQLLFPKLLAIFVDISEGEPYDHFGQLFMELGFSEDRKGQFFTPPELAEMIAKMTLMSMEEKLVHKAFITMSEPACGAGSMLLASVKVLMQAGYNPANMLWMQAVDIDRVSALMCYIQLTLWHVPAEVIVGDALSLDYREHWFTPSHYLGGWSQKLAWRKMIEHIKELDHVAPLPHPVENPIIREEKLASVEKNTTQKSMDTPPLNPHSHTNKVIVAKKDQISFDF